MKIIGALPGLAIAVSLLQALETVIGGVFIINPC
jgi:uncharacterized membrane protein